MTIKDSQLSVLRLLKLSGKVVDPFSYRDGLLNMGILSEELGIFQSECSLSSEEETRKLLVPELQSVRINLIPVIREP